MRRQRIEVSSGRSSGGRSGSISGRGRGCEVRLHLGNLFMDLLQERFVEGSHGRIDSVRLASVNGRGLRIRLLSSNV